MRRHEVVLAVKRAGYTHVQTAAGALPIEDWTPYGATASDARMFSCRVTGWEFSDDADSGPRIVDCVPPGEVAGVWPVGPRLLTVSGGSEVSSDSPC